MSAIQDLAERNTNKLHGKVCWKGNAAKHILDADCRYEEGAFALFSLPCKLPEVFTVRFTAPEDFTPGDILTLKGREFAIRTRMMEEPESALFSAGAVVQCDIDMERDLAFFAAGGGENAGGLPSGVMFQTGNLSFYIDPNGDDSLNNPGTVDSPFRTLLGAKNAVSQRYIFTSMGNLTYNINPGTYELDTDNREAMCNATHPQNIVFQASDPLNKPILIADGFSSSRGERIYKNLHLEATTSNVVTASTSATIYLSDTELFARAANTKLIHAGNNSMIFIQGSLVLDGGGNPADTALSSYGGCLAARNIVVKIQNLPSVGCFVFCGGNSYLNLTLLTFIGSTTGMRYRICQGGVLDVDSPGMTPNYFPGTIAGLLTGNGEYTV